MTNISKDDEIIDLTKYDDKFCIVCGKKLEMWEKLFCSRWCRVKNTASKIRWQNNRLLIGNKLIGYTVKAQKGLILVCPKKSKHKFRMYNSWGIPAVILDELIAKNFYKIRIVVDEGKKILDASPLNWKLKGFHHHSRGYEEQIQLREKDFDLIV